MNAPFQPGGGPRIPPPPPQAGRRRKGDQRWLLWLGMLVIGAGTGVAIHRLLPDAADVIDGWVAMALR